MVGVLLFFWLLLVFWRFVVELCIDFGGGEEGWLVVMDERLVVNMVLFGGELGFDCLKE